ncbi:hypothetical protein NLI96_g1917 [Meripilus lineatus]|uniref:F-box domain-containing protein n=1 Tax=Meripilus lineatus TaxID=2056292 RepID=A0AAD5VBQ6_9APHY|nr:hypothetical protein NLI96_g1917 [Physisporinus lineatus]
MDSHSETNPECILQYAIPGGAVEFNVTISDLPNELFLVIFSGLPLPSLISARDVSQRWRDLVAAADIGPTRKKLLQLYFQVITSPALEPCRRELTPYLQSFNRQQFLHSRQSSIGATSLPEEFALWILEWPSHAVFSWLWPGLPPDPNTSLKYSLKTRMNHLAYQNCSSSESWLIQFKENPGDGQWTASEPVPPPTTNYCSLLRIRTQSEYLGTGYSTDYLMCDGWGKGTQYEGRVITASSDSETNKNAQFSWVDYLKAELEAVERLVG